MKCQPKFAAAHTANILRYKFSLLAVKCFFFKTGFFFQIFYAVTHAIFFRFWYLGLINLTTY